MLTEKAVAAGVSAASAISRVDEMTVAAPATLVTVMVTPVLPLLGVGVRGVDLEGHTVGGTDGAEVGGRQGRRYMAVAPVHNDRTGARGKVGDRVAAGLASVKVPISGLVVGGTPSVPVKVKPGDAKSGATATVAELAIGDGVVVAPGVRRDRDRRTTREREATAAPLVEDRHVDRVRARPKATSCRCACRRPGSRPRHRPVRACTIVPADDVASPQSIVAEKDDALLDSAGGWSAKKNEPTSTLFSGTSCAAEIVVAVPVKSVVSVELMIETCEIPV